MFTRSRKLYPCRKGFLRPCQISRPLIERIESRLLMTSVHPLVTPATATVTGNVYFDKNASLTNDSGDTPLAGRQVYADIGNKNHYVSGDPTTTTDASGNFTLTGVPAGAVLIRQVLPGGWTQTAPSDNDGIEVNASAGATVNVGGFGEITPADLSISGVVFNDLNDSGGKNSKDPGVSDVTVYIDGNNNGSLDSGEQSHVSGPDGSFAFTGLLPGTYVVRAETPSGFKQSFPQSGTADVVNLIVKRSVNNANFGEAKDNTKSVPPPPPPSSSVATVIGSVYFDKNASLVNDAGDSPLAGRQVYADIGNKNHYVSGDPTTTTDTNGNYTLTGVPTGAVVIRQVLPGGWTQTTPTDSDGIEVNAAAGATVHVEGFGEITPADLSISGVVFNDLNNSGGKNSRDPGVSDVTVYIDTNNDGKLDNGEQSNVSGPDGSYSFGGLLPGTYVVRAVTPSGFKQTFPQSGTGNTVNLIVKRSVNNANFGETLIKST